MMDLIDSYSGFIAIPTISVLITVIVYIIVKDNKDFL